MIKKIFSKLKLFLQAPVSRCPFGCWEEDANGDCVIKDSCQVSVSCSTAGMNIQDIVNPFLFGKIDLYYTIKLPFPVKQG